MTEKYLNQLARALANSRPSNYGLMVTAKYRRAQMDQWLEDVDMIANVCEANNPRFKRGLFIAACKTW